MSMVRFLVYSNQFDVEGLIATTSTWMKNKVRPDVIQTLVDAYEQVRPKLLRASARVPSRRRAAGRDRARASPPTAWRPSVPTRPTRGRRPDPARRRRRADPRPLVGARVGRREHARAGAAAGARDEVAGRARRARRRSCASTRSPIRTMPGRGSGGSFRRSTTSRCRRRPTAISTTYATWTGISGDRFYKNAPGADFTTFTDAWVERQHPQQGATRQALSDPCCIHEGDTPAFLGLINNGLASFMSPTYGGWGGRYVWRTFYGETRPSWTQGGDSFPGPRQLEGHGHRRRRTDLHVGPGDDLAVADGIPARLRGADGLDDQGRHVTPTTTPRSS